MPEAGSEQAAGGWIEVSEDLLFHVPDGGAGGGVSTEPFGRQRDEPGSSVAGIRPTGDQAGRLEFVEEDANAYDLNMEIEFVTSIAVVAPDPPASRELYVDALGLPLEGGDPNGYHSSENVPGVKHFGVWPLSEAAEACFGTDQWPTDLPVPQVSIEFEVATPDAVQTAADELEARGFSFVHGARKEPWGQTVARLLSIEGSIVGISYAPALHD